ncbi:MAG: hypothetical protein JWM57_2450 [Phycisphaerales bacterium]|nr:hypothetical protein [Phycisphaerales bacterium]
MLILGDSVTWSAGYGWDHGVTKAAGEVLGLAGSGLIGDSGATGQGYGAVAFGGAFFGNGFATTLDAVPVDRQGYALRVGVPAVTAGTTPLNGFSFGVTGQAPQLDPAAAYDWHLYTASAPGGGSLRGYRRIVSATTISIGQTLSAVATATPPVGLEHTVLHFNASPTSPAGVQQEMRLDDVQNTSIFYSRVIKPGATGVTVSSLGLGGNPTKNFYNQVYAAMSPAGRTAYLSNLVDGGTGKLNVMLAEGFNDRNDRTLSLNGVDFGYTQAGFRDNITTLIGLMRSDWSAAGKSGRSLVHARRHVSG